ncbi:hypothetical protein G7Y89_g13578 [Cudoniella acicularis]|uniref:Uncharacterized protein n=1 Tax=Cudoniella acicularis TaxID=354080 RepID=A0A8H4RAE7_9HELO|nr:hypothetical protein G7Y89_g13578 [Cudoniella acicularis]
MAMVIQFAVKGVAAGIGLASEGIQNHKEKKRAKKAGLVIDDDGESSTSTISSHHPPSLNLSDQDVSVFELEADEAQWELDEAQDELNPSISRQESEITLTDSKGKEKKKETRDLKTIVDAFVRKYPPPTKGPGSIPKPRIQLPVIIPQRRPKARARGFIKAYAPVLEEAGIDQAMFLDFLDTFNKSTEASPWINVLNFANIAGFFVPFGIGVAIQVAVTLTIKVSQEIQGRTRTTSFIHDMNDKFFQPRGLYCFVLTWNPESSETYTSVDTTTNIAKASNLSSPSFLQKLKTSNGNSYGDCCFQETAPLIFPGLDAIDADPSNEAKGKREKLKRGMAFAADYSDRRARATYQANHPESLLAQGPKEKFKSRYADPNHPASSGNLISLITGGKINPPSLSSGNGEGLSGLMNASNSDNNARIGPLTLVAPVVKGVSKVLGKNVLYLMIVNMPTNEEMASAMSMAEISNFNSNSSARCPVEQKSSFQQHPWQQDNVLGATPQSSPYQHYQQNISYPPEHHSSGSRSLGPMTPDQSLQQYNDWLREQHPEACSRPVQFVSPQIQSSGYQTTDGGVRRQRQDMRYGTYTPSTGGGVQYSGVVKGPGPEQERRR